MRRVFCWFVCLSFCYFFTSCYAYLKAEKMIYQGSVAKGKPSVILSEDSISTTYAVE